MALVLRRFRLSSLWTIPLCLVIFAGLTLPGIAHAQIPGGPPLTCKQLWDEAGAQAALAAQEKANLVAGAAPGAAASRWAQAWAQAWRATWAAQGAGLKQSLGGGCCDTNWFEHAALAGKAAWEKAWLASVAATGADRAWTEKYAAAYADAWAKEWFLHFPVLCAKAGVNAVVNVLADARAWAKADAWAWALAVAGAGGFEEASSASFSESWGAAGSAAWATAGAAAIVEVSASAEAWAAAGVSGNCAVARAGACAQAAAAAFAAAWAAAGASAFAEAHADAWAEASARAYARAWALAFARADARAFASAIADAWASSLAQAFAAAWRQKLADQGQLPAIVSWWTTRGAAMPAIRTVQKLMALAYRSTFRWAFRLAVANALKTRKDWDRDSARAAKEAFAEADAAASSWVSKWSESWAVAWATAWAETYRVYCRRAAAEVCKECPCTTTTTTGRPRTVGRPDGFTPTLVGLGVTAGSIFQIVVHNTTGEQIVVEVPAGTVFKPSDPEHQRMVISEDQRLTVPPNQSAQAPLQGYCLDYGKQPPPATTLGALAAEPVLVATLDPTLAMPAMLEPQGPAGAVKYQVDENPAYASFLRIIQAGNRLAGEGKFHTDLPPDKHKLTVIQRALWTYATRNKPAPHTRETLLADIRRQVKESGGTQTDDQIQELVNHIAEDVESVLRAANAM